MAERLPKHIVEGFGSTRAFKAYSRAGVRAALRALEKAQRGCAYHPFGVQPIASAIQSLREALDAMSVKKWGR